MPTWRAYAKINLSLEILGRRHDGYHDVLTILQTVDLHDTLTVEPAEEVVLTCDQPTLINDDNLVLRAARLLQRTTGRTEGAAIHLEKGIPLAAGLGGGSSDAATTLVALSELWGLRMSEANLQNLAAVLGSDVPFFLVGGTVLASERGQTLQPLPDLPEHWVVLVRPALDIPDKTRLMYSNITPREYSTGTVTRHMARMLQDSRRLEPGLIFNAFEWIAYQRFERIDEVRQHFVDAGADRVRLCGAGPSLYAIYPEEAPARGVYEQLRADGLDVYIARTLTVRPRVLPPSPADEPGEEKLPARRSRAKSAAKKPRTRKKAAPAEEAE
jgi:4-diphosphocytidyl-2-C-methyl-D-erythritol kinase